MRVPSGAVKWLSATLRPPLSAWDSLPGGKSPVGPGSSVGAMAVLPNEADRGYGAEVEAVDEGFDGFRFDTPLAPMAQRRSVAGVAQAWRAQVYASGALLHHLIAQVEPQRDDMVRSRLFRHLRPPSR